MIGSSLIYGTQSKRLSRALLQGRGEPRNFSSHEEKNDSKKSSILFRHFARERADK